MRVAKFPHHKNFATFDYGITAVKKPEVEQLCTGQFTTDAHNLILVGGTGTGKTHFAIALGAALINQGKKARFHNAVDLINCLDQRTGRGQCPSQRLHANACRSVDAKVTTALLDRVTHHCSIIETGNDSFRFA